MITIENSLIIISLLLVVIPGYLAYTQEKGMKRRVTIGVGIVFSLISVLLVAEKQTREIAIQGTIEEAKREWILINESQITDIELELLAPDGSFFLKNLLDTAQKIHFGIDNIAADPKTGESKNLLIDFSDIFVPENISGHGRLGRSIMKVVGNSNNIKQKNIKNTSCYSSEFITNTLLIDHKKNKNVLVCSATIKMAFPFQDVQFSSLSDVPRVFFIITAPEKIGCVGSCQKGVIVSIRLVLASGKKIEFSPQIYSNPVVATEDSILYELSGKSLSSLSESHFIESMGYKNIKHFILTRGLIYKLNMGEHTDVVKVVGRVWTTDTSPSQKSLIRSVTDSSYNQKTTFSLAFDEWCGFGTQEICWNRFVVVEK